MRKILFLLLWVLFIGGCTGKVVHITPSGMVEVTVVRPFTNQVSRMLQSRMEDRGYELLSTKGNDLVFRRLTKEGLVAFFDGVGVTMSDARIIYHVSTKANSFNLTASFALVKNPGSYDESIKYVNDHGDTVKYQKMLNEFKIDVEAMSQPKVAVVASPDTTQNGSSGLEVYDAYFRDAEKKKNESAHEKRKKLYEAVKELPASDYEGNLKGYSELLSLYPDEPLYQRKARHYLQKIADRDSRKVRKRSSTGTKARTYRQPKEVYVYVSGTEDVVYNSPWDGSVRQAERYLKRHLKDPDSFEAIDWGKVQKTTTAPYKFKTWCKYRSRNSFGGYVIEKVLFVMDSSGEIIGAIRI